MFRDEIPLQYLSPKCKVDEYALKKVYLNEVNAYIPDPPHVAYPWNESRNCTLQLSNRSPTCTRLEDATGNIPLKENLTDFEELKAWEILCFPQTNSENQTFHHGEKKMSLDTVKNCVKIRTCESKGSNQSYSNMQNSHDPVPHLHSVSNKSACMADLSDKNCSFDDHLVENIPESPVTGRIPSPSSASSITSGRRLEWDSGADVGYILNEVHVPCDTTSSTIERIALVRGCTASLFERLDPEGTCGPSLVLGAQTSLKLDSPIAKSTPVYRTESQTLNFQNVDETPITPLVEPTETVLPGGYLYLYSHEEFESEVAPSPDNGKPENMQHSDQKRDESTAFNLNKKHSNSFTDLNLNQGEVLSSVPRSQSYLNLLSKETSERQLEQDLRIHHTQTLVATCSVSSSSVATIVQQPISSKTSDKIVQTLPLKYSVGVQACENRENIPSFPLISTVSCDIASQAASLVEDSKSVSNMEKNSLTQRCGGAHKKGSDFNGQCSTHRSLNGMKVSDNENDKLNMNYGKEIKKIEQNQGCSSVEEAPMTLNSATSSQTVESSCAPDTSCSGGGILSGHHGSAVVVDSENSFEYLPGDMFQDTFKNESSTKSTEPETSSSKRLCKSSISPHGSERCSSSLSKDIEGGVEMLQKLMDEKSYNSRTKNKLIRQIINKLVSTDYKEDSVEEIHRVSLSSNVPWVPAVPTAQCLKPGSYNYMGAGDWKNKIKKSDQDSCGNTSNGGSKSKSTESAVSEMLTSASTYAPSGSLSVPGDNEQSLAESSEVSSKTVSRNATRNWKYSTSRIEKEFDTKKLDSNNVDTNSLLRLCKSEHEKQLQWIRFEIDHLSHLKQLLEKQGKSTKTLSNLIDHKHKFHSINQPNNKSEHCKLQRSKEESLCSHKENTESSRHKTSLETNSSEKFHPHKHMSLHYQNSHAPDCALYQPEKPSEIKKTNSKYDLSMQTLSLDSYILANPEIRQPCMRKPINSNSQSSDGDGKINVYIQTSPTAVKNREKADERIIPLRSQASENAKKSCKCAIKCCYECKKIHENIHLENSQKKDQQFPLFCRYAPDSLGAASGSEYSSFEKSDTADEINSPQIQNLNTILNKSVQTSQSLDELPTSNVNPASIGERCNGRSTTKKVHKKIFKYCPCQLSLHKQELSNRSVNQSEDNTKKSSYIKEESPHKICDASVQTSAHVKDPLAYLLTFEPTCEENKRSLNNDSLPEIKLLVPVSANLTDNGNSKRFPYKENSKENQKPLDNIQHLKNTLNDRSVQVDERKKHKLTLQECLRANRPDYVQHADKRSQCLADLALLRDLRKQKRLELLKLTDKVENLESKEVKSKERIVGKNASAPDKPKMSTFMMREQTRKNYRKTNEVRNKLAEKKKKEDFRTNRLMAELFTKKLQKRVLEGVVNHSNSTSVISSIL